MIERFGGLDIVDPGLLPIGMVNLFREEGGMAGLMEMASANIEGCLSNLFDLLEFEDL